MKDERESARSVMQTLIITLQIARFIPIGNNKGKYCRFAWAHNPRIFAPIELGLE